MNRVVKETTLLDSVGRKGLCETITFEPGCELWEEMCSANSEQRKQGILTVEILFSVH